MNFVPAKCTCCGGSLQVDPTQEAAICQFCGMPFVVEKAINNYNVNNYNGTVNNITDSEVHIHQNGETAEQLLENIKALLKREDCSAADKLYQQLKEKYPADYRVDEAGVVAYLYGGKIERDFFDGSTTLDTERNFFEETGYEAICEDGYRTRGFFEELEKLKETNREVYQSYYEPFREALNQYISMCLGRAFNGGLLALKVGLRNCFWGSAYFSKADVQLVCRKGLRYDRMNDGTYQFTPNMHHFEYEYCQETAIKLANQNKENNDTDDEFIIAFASEIDKAVAWSRNWKPTEWDRHLDEDHPDWRNKKAESEKAAVRFRDALLRLLSPQGKTKLAEEQERAKEEQERKKKEARRNAIKNFWNEYARLLRSGRLKDAYQLISSGAPARGTNKEFAKFKKGLFGVKYLGTPSSFSEEAAIARSLQEEGL